MSAQTLSDHELADEWDCNIQLVQKLLRTGKLAGYKVGNMWRIDRPAIDAYKAANTRAAS